MKDNLRKTQEMIKFFIDKKRSEREFVVAYMVYLKLQPYRQISTALIKYMKLSSKFYRPFKVFTTIGNITYRLDLPFNSKLIWCFMFLY